MNKDETVERYKATDFKHVYWSVTPWSRLGSYNWIKVFGGNKRHKTGFKTAREAAIALDKVLIAEGLEPLIMKRR